ncbi:elongator complex protein 5, partial [Lecanoromycetidae sp. Uapishka_2]
MAERALQHRRVHNLLLIQKLLGLRGESSPFTLILDTVEQSARSLLEHYIHNASSAKIDVVFISYETIKPPLGATTVIKARGKDAATVQQAITAAVTPTKRTLLILDTLYPLACSPELSLPGFLSSIMQSSTSTVAVYHTDIPLPTSTNPYAPSPLTALKYLATAILTVHNFDQVVARKRAAERSLIEPVFGLAEEREGVIIGKGANRMKGVVVEMEYRRKSGRGVEEWFFLPTVSSNNKVTLLDDHPLYRRPDSSSERTAADEAAAELSTFDLGLTAKQRRDREGVVLPYFDAQEGAGGTGGRILYDMGVEDDFDEEEDEI